MTYKIQGDVPAEGELKIGQVLKFPLGDDQTAQLEAQPAKNFDLGQGPGKPIRTTLHGGVVGIVLDGRGRPLGLAENKEERRKQLLEWGEALELYPS